VITYEIPGLKLVSEANQREHWAKKAKRAKRSRHAGYAYTLAEMGSSCGIPDKSHATVTITRIGVRKLDCDNLAGSAKALRDGIADALRVDDGSKRVKWRYQQETGGKKSNGMRYGVRVEIDIKGEYDARE